MTTSEERGWEDDYPEVSAGWEFNRKMEDIEEHALKSGAIFLSIFAVLLLIVVVEAFYETYGPFFLWRMSVEPYNLALYNTVAYAVILLILGAAFFYYGARLVWQGWKQRRK